MQGWRGGRGLPREVTHPYLSTDMVQGTCRADIQARLFDAWGACALAAAPTKGSGRTGARKARPSLLQPLTHRRSSGSFAPDKLAAKGVRKAIPALSTLQTLTPTVT